jgi:Reverse transcriptase (RNA-dependent DNA polymerase)
MDAPVYPHDPIRSVQSLSRALGLGEPTLKAIASRAHKLYTEPKPKSKKNGGVRYVYDTKVPLKPLLKNINQVLFRHVVFPYYLTGSLAGSDFVANVDIHKGSQIIIEEDIAQFFDCITSVHVHRIWSKFFGFSDEVSELLTRLTTKDGRVFQGTPTSSYLANLAFWDRESALITRLHERGFQYSRYVDDIAISTKKPKTREDIQWAIAQVYAMIGGAGFAPKRAKHKIQRAHRPITLMGLNANSLVQPTLRAKERSAIRAQVFQLENEFFSANTGLAFRQKLNQAKARLGRLKRFHPVEALALKARLKTVSSAVDVLPFTTEPIQSLVVGIGADDPPF